MENSNFAAIDIGSNGARLLIKNVIEDAGGNYEFNKVLFLRIPLRLGKDVFIAGARTHDDVHDKELQAANEALPRGGIQGLRHVCHARCRQRAEDSEENPP